MPRPFRKGIACHGSMYTLPFCPELFVDLDNDTVDMGFDEDTMQPRTKPQLPEHDCKKLKEKLSKMAAGLSLLAGRMQGARTSYEKYLLTRVASSC